MNSFLFDENLPANLRFTPVFPVIHVSVLGDSPSDTQIWRYANLLLGRVDICGIMVICQPSLYLIHNGQK